LTFEAEDVRRAYVSY